MRSPSIASWSDPALQVLGRSRVWALGPPPRFPSFHRVFAATPPPLPAMRTDDADCCVTLSAEAFFRRDGSTVGRLPLLLPSLLFAAVCIDGARIRRRRCFAPPRRCAPRLQAAVDASLRSSTPVSELVSSSFAFLGAAAIVFLFAVYFRRLERLFRRRFVPALSPWSAVFLGVPVACVRLRLPLFHDVCLRILAAASPPPPPCVWDSGAIRPVFGEDLVSRRPFLYVCSEGAGG